MDYENDTYFVDLLADEVKNSQYVDSYEYAYFGDYDGDCLSDIVLLKNYTEDGMTSCLQFIRGTQNE